MAIGKWWLAVGEVPRGQQAGDEIRIDPSPQEMTRHLRRCGIGVFVDHAAGEPLPNVGRGRFLTLIGRALSQLGDQPIWRTGEFAVGWVMISDQLYGRPLI